MEFPITVMIVLFVSIIVGSSVIYFSDHNLQNAKENLNDVADLNKDKQEDLFIELLEVSSKDVSNLAQQCYDDNKNSLESKTCFVIMGEIKTICDNIISNLGSSPIKLTCNINPDANAIKIYFNAPLGKIEIMT